MNRKRQINVKYVDYSNSQNKDPLKYEAKDISTTTKDNCSNCEHIKHYMEDLLNKKIDIIEAQNVQIMQTLGELQVLTKLLVRQEESTANLKSSFPLATIEDLYKLDGSLNADNKILYVAAIKGLIRNNLSKNIELIMTEDLVNDFNVDGTHGKKRLKDFKNVFAAIGEAVGANDEVKDVEGHIRKAIQLSKKRLFKKRNGNKPINDIDTINDMDI